MGVFGDDFAAVDVREELCYHSRPKKHKFRGDYTSVRVQKGWCNFIRNFAPLLHANLQNLEQK